MVGILFLFGMWFGVAASTILIAAFVFHRELVSGGGRAVPERARTRADGRAARVSMPPRDRMPTR